MSLACGTGDPGDGNAQTGGFVFQTPTLVAVTPAQVSLGTEMQATGGNFLDTKHGKNRLHFHGSFTAAQSGERNDYDGDAPLQFVNAGSAQLEFGPRVIFTPSGDKIGSFTGTAQVIAQLLDTGEERASAAIPVQVVVGPSLLVDQLKSADANCPQAVTDSTIGGTNLLLGLRAIGLPAATGAAPLTFRVRYTSPLMVAQFARNTSYPQWPPPDMPAYQVPPPDGVNAFEVTITSGSAVSFNPKTQQQAVKINPPVTIQQDMLTDVKLSRFATGPVGGTGGAQVNLLVDVTQKGGGSAQRNIHFTAYKELDVEPWDHAVHIAERFTPTEVSACFTGGDIGRDLTYTEGTADTRSRSLGWHWDIQAAYSVGLQIGSPQWMGLLGLFNLSFDAHWAQTFSTDVSVMVSSETSVSQALTGHILPTYFGACYRQTERLQKQVNLIYHSACGMNGPVGKVVLDDWDWGFDIATGRTCPPATNLPPAQKFGDLQ